MHAQANQAGCGKVGDGAGLRIVSPFEMARTTKWCGGVSTTQTFRTARSVMPTISRSTCAVACRAVALHQGSWADTRLCDDMQMNNAARGLA